MILTEQQLIGRQLTPGVTNNNAFNICAIVIGRGAKQVLVISVYIAQWTIIADTYPLHKTLDNIVINFK